MSMRATLIINDYSGDAESSNRDKLPEITELLAAGGIECDTTFTTPERTAEVIARDAVAAGAKLVIVCGGDGTVSMVARELVNRPATLGIIPLGTFNNIARSVGIPAQIPAACEIITNQHTHAIDVGLINDEHYFFEAAGVGLDAELFPAGEAVKDGQWTAIFSALAQAAQFQTAEVEIHIDSELGNAIPADRSGDYSPAELSKSAFVREPLLIVIANGSYYGGGFAIAPDAEIRDAALTVNVFSDFSKAELAAHFIALFNDQEVDQSRVETFLSADVELITKTPLAVHADGLPCTTTPATFKTLPGALRVLAPNAL